MAKESLLLSLLRLMRPEQWYKNLVVFLALIFSGNLFDWGLFKLSFAAFFIFCIMSAVNYIINDMRDVNFDKHNPEKKKRPIASGRLRLDEAGLVAFILFLTAIILAFMLDMGFALLIIIYFVLTSLYTFIFKEVRYIEIIFVAVNYILRAVGGGLAIDVHVSQWLILGAFSFALFMIVGKRKGEQKLYLVNARKVRYNPVILNQLVTISTTFLLVCFSLYTFSSAYPHLIWTLPLFLYLILRFLHHVNEEDPVSRHPHYIVWDIQFLLGSAAFLVMSYFILY